MLVWVQTFTMTHEDFELKARFYHSVARATDGCRTRLVLLGKKVALTIRRNARQNVVAERRKRERPYHLDRSRRRALLNQNPCSVTPANSIVPKNECNPPIVPQLASLSLPDAVGNMSPDQPALSPQDLPQHTGQSLSTDATAQHLAQWLQVHRFNAYVRFFADFSGEDILRLSRDDLIQICGLPDGIRLYNALRSKCIAPQLTIYLCVEQSPPQEHHALFLHTLSLGELSDKLAQLLGISVDQILKIYVQGPVGTHVVVTDDVVRNVKDDSLFAIEVLPDQSGERYRLLLKPVGRHQ